MRDSDALELSGLGLASRDETSVDPAANVIDRDSGCVGEAPQAHVTHTAIFAPSADSGWPRLIHASARNLSVAGCGSSEASFESAFRG